MKSNRVDGARIAYLLAICLPLCTFDCVLHIWPQLEVSAILAVRRILEMESEKENGVPKSVHFVLF